MRRFLMFGVRSAVPTVAVADVLEWLRSDEGEQARIDADREGVPAEDMIAHRLEAALQDRQP
jgi:hypothetical protein